MAELKLEGQQWYRTRNGVIAFCIGKVPLEQDDRFVVCVGAITCFYFENGDFIRTDKSEFDIVEHLPDCTGFNWMPSKPVYKVGDWVRVTKPKNTLESPGWFPDMDALDNKTLCIKHVLTTDEWVQFSGNDYWFSTKWLELVDEPEASYKDISKRIESLSERMKSDFDFT